MAENLKEAFEKTKIAGSIAAGALDEVNKIIKPGISTNEIDKVCYEFINDNKAFSAPLFYRGFQSHVVLLQIMLCVMEFHQIKF